MSWSIVRDKKGLNTSLTIFLPFWAILRHGKVVNVVKVSKPTYLVMIWHKRGPSVDVLLSGGNHNFSGCKIPNPSNFRGWNSQCLCLDQKVGAWQIRWFVNKKNSKFRTDAPFWCQTATCCGPRLELFVNKIQKPYSCPAFKHDC